MGLDEAFPGDLCGRGDGAGEVRAEGAHCASDEPILPPRFGYAESWNNSLHVVLSLGTLALGGGAVPRVWATEASGNAPPTGPVTRAS